MKRICKIGLHKCYMYLGIGFVLFRGKSDEFLPENNLRNHYFKASMKEITSRISDMLDCVNGHDSIGNLLY